MIQTPLPHSMKPSKRTPEQTNDQFLRLFLRFSKDDELTYLCKHHPSSKQLTAHIVQEFHHCTPLTITRDNYDSLFTQTVESRTPFATSLAKRLLTNDPLCQLLAQLPIPPQEICYNLAFTISSAYQIYNEHKLHPNTRRNTSG